MTRYAAFVRAVNVGGRNPVPMAELAQLFAFLGAPPSRAPALPLVSTKDGLELFRIEERDALVISRRLKNGRFGFPNLFVERELEVAATSRNWNTITRILAAQER